MNNDFKVGFDEEKEVIVINDNIKTLGAVSYSISKVKEKDEYGLDTDAIEITGILVTEYYNQEITKIETARYLIDDIDVEKEEFGSKEDRIAYHFKAKFARVKYQTGDYERI